MAHGTTRSKYHVEKLCDLMPQHLAGVGNIQ